MNTFSTSIKVCGVALLLAATTVAWAQQPKNAGKMPAKGTPVAKKAAAKKPAGAKAPAGKGAAPAIAKSKSNAPGHSATFVRGAAPTKNTFTADIGPKPWRKATGDSVGNSQSKGLVKQPSFDAVLKKAEGGKELLRASGRISSPSGSFGSELSVHITGANLVEGRLYGKGPGADTTATVEVHFMELERGSIGNLLVSEKATATITYLDRAAGLVAGTFHATADDNGKKVQISHGHFSGKLVVE